MSRRIGQITVIQGGQYGSESKGMVAEQWARENRIENVIRTGSINAGHTVYAADRTKFVFQQIPTAAISHLHNRYRPNIYIGPGAYIHEPTLDTEVKMVEERDPQFKKRLFIDHRATMHTDDHMMSAKEANRHLSMGSTGKGCSEVMVRKISMRGKEPRVALASDRLAGKYNLVDLSEHIRGTVLIEGTQGADLDVHLGPYPYVTSRMTSVAAWVAESGLPCIDVRPVVVFRSFPIRVAGNSGPMLNEISWPELAREINRKLLFAGKPYLVNPYVVDAFEEKMAGLTGYSVDCSQMHRLKGEERVVNRTALSEAGREALNSMTDQEVTELKKLFEFTTVTRKLRRIARFDYEQARRVINRDGAQDVVFTFMNYMFPDVESYHESVNWAKGVVANTDVKNVHVSFNPYGYGPAYTL